MDRGAWWAPWGHKGLDTTEQLTVLLIKKILMLFIDHLVCFT